MHTRPITIAFTHLVLLLGVTPILASALASPAAPPSPAQPRWRPLFAAVSAATMCGALAALGWPWLGTRVAVVGLDPLRLLSLIGISGVVAAGAWLTVLPRLYRRRELEVPA